MTEEIGMDVPLAERLTNQCSDEIRYSRDAVENKRNIFRENLRQYVEPNKAEGKVDSNILYSAINTAVAIEYSDKLSVLFMPRKFGAEENADNLTSLAEYDYDEMGLQEINYQRSWDRQFFGVGIRVKSGWDGIRNCPVWEVKDPLSWLPDPMGNHIDPFRFHYFEEELEIGSVTEENGFEPDAKEFLCGSTNPNTELNKDYRDNASGIIPSSDNIPNRTVSVVNGYTVLDGVKYSVTLDWAATKVVRFKKLALVTKEQREDPTLKKFPVVVSWLSPLRGDPYGVSLCDLIVDKQKAQKILSNLQLTGAKFATFGQMYLYDGRAVKNIQDLRRPSTEPKFISYDSASGVPISNSLYPVPRENITQDSFAVSQQLVNQIYSDTGIDARSQGVQGDKSITKGESQQIQANANVRLGLNLSVNFWSEKLFWSIWLETYREYFGKGDEKYVRITKGFDSIPQKLRKDDFMGNEDPDIVIDSENSVNAKREKMRLSFSAAVPMLLADPSIPKVSKTYAIRYNLRLSGIPKDMINVMTFDPVEVDAKMKVALLNENDFAGAEIEDMNQDHLTYMLVFSQGVDTPAKGEAIRRRKEAIAYQQAQALQQGSWQNPQGGQNGQAMQGIANATASQNVSANLSAMGNGIISTEDIAASNQ